MRRLFSLLIVGIFVAGGCKKESEPCNSLAAAVGLEFRVVDTAGNDLVHALMDTAYISNDTLILRQPCNSSYLTTIYKDYRIPGRTDTGTVISFGNLRTPDYGEPSDCYRIIFNWPNDDEDTVDWHYRIDEVEGCKMQIIDYLSFNGAQALKKTDYAHEYYQLIKR